MQEATFCKQSQDCWFYAGIVFTTVFAMFYPSLGAADGPLVPETTIPYIAIPLIYVLTLQKESRYNKSTNTTTDILMTLTLCFVINPVIAYIITIPAKLFGINDWILKGFIATSCMPPPLASGLVLCSMNNIRNIRKSKYGILSCAENLESNNHSVLFVTASSSVIGALIGCFITPVILYLFIGFGAVPAIFPCLVSSLIAIVSLSVSYICPRKFLPSSRCNLQISQTLVLFSVYCNMCDIFMEAQTSLQATEVLQSLLLVFVLQLCLFLISKMICSATNNSSLLGPMVFCGAHKSVTLGFPMMKTMFGGLSHHILFSLPLLLYYSTQMFTGALLIQSDLIN